MKITFKTTTHRLLSVLLCGALLWAGFSAQPSFLGPGLSAAAAEMAATQTDILLPNENQPLTATATSQWMNIVCAFKLTRNDMVDIHFTVGVDETVSSDTDFWSYDYAPAVTFDEILVDTAPDDDRVAEVTIVSEDGAFPSDTALFYCYFNSQDTYANAVASIQKDFLGGYKQDYTWLSANDESALAMQPIMVGDVNGNGAIGADDALAILQNVSGTPLTEVQELAADCNKNGSVGADDALQIQNYVVGNVCSLWDQNRVQLPTQHSNHLNDSFVYRLRNKATGEYLSMNPANAMQACAVSNYNPKQQYAKFELKKVANQPYYTLRNKANNTTLRLDNNYNASFNNTTDGFIPMSGYWYLAPSTGGYELVSYPLQDRALTTYGEMLTNGQDCKADYANRGTVWVLEGPKITISYHYDRGYNDRFGTAGVANIHIYQQKIATILENVFHADVTLVNSATDVTTSRADACGATINSPCPENHRLTNDCIANCETYPYNTSHHKNANDMLLYWYTQLPTATKGKTIHIMYSGHIPCIVKDENNDGTNDTHKTMSNTYQLYGLTYSSSRVAVAYSNTNDSTREDREKLTPLHEISHDIGAGGRADTNHGDCVMSYNKDPDTLISWFNSNDSTDHEKLFCNVCHNAVVAYLAQNY